MRSSPGCISTSWSPSSLPRRPRKKARRFSDANWKEALRTARVSYAIAGQVKEFKFNRFAFGAGLLLQLGKMLMAVSFPKEMADRSWAAFLTECDLYKTERKRAFEQLERRKFPISHNELAALFVSFFSLFRPIEKAIYYYKEPYFLKKASPDLYLMSVVLSIADAYSYRPAEPVHLNQAQVEGLKALKITPAVLETVVKKQLAEPPKEAK